ncbi:MAG: hypothetical protein L6R36_006431 [Xanthoria steineri]|nr:MAG: hypothetical protein L6R36_006431 [Xanthoria steineri]
MPRAIIAPGDEDYDSAADSDFGGSLSPSSGDESSASEAGGTKGAKSRSRQKRSIEDSGDEGVVKEGKKKRRKKDKSAPKEEAGLDESAIGMRVRERKLGRAADLENKPLASSEGATVDVDALWAKLNTAAAPPKPLSQPHTNGARNEEQVHSKDSLQSETLQPDRSTALSGDDQSMPSQPPPEDSIVIKRTYVFAGETITEEKTVPKSSAEARLYLQSQATPASPISPIGGKPLRRPKKRPSMFEPNPEGIVKGLAPTPGKGPKLNVVEKSKLDWASHVDKEGLKDELDVAEKAKDGYMGRMDFLGRSEAKREEERKNAKRK